MPDFDEATILYFPIAIARHKRPTEAKSCPWTGLTSGIAKIDESSLG